MRIHKGDKVKIITGSYKGTVGEVIKVSPKDEKVMIEGANLVKKHIKPTDINPDGGIIETEAWIHVSNVQIYDPKAKESSRIGYKIVDNKKARYFKKSGQLIK